MRRLASIISFTSEDLTDTTSSSNPKRSRRRMFSSALSASASAVGAPYFAAICLSSDPPLTPTRTGTPSRAQVRATARTRSSSPMLPGLMRIFEIPASAASIASL